MNCANRPGYRIIWKQRVKFCSSDYCNYLDNFGKVSALAKCGSVHFSIGCQSQPCVGSPKKVMGYREGSVVRYWKCYCSLKKECLTSPCPAHPCPPLSNILIHNYIIPVCYLPSFFYCNEFTFLNFTYNIPCLNFGENLHQTKLCFALDLKKLPQCWSRMEKYTSYTKIIFPKCSLISL